MLLAWDILLEIVFQKIRNHNVEAQKKLEFRAHVYFQAVWPQIVHVALQPFIGSKNNPLHKNNLTSTGETKASENTDSNSPDNSFNDDKISDNDVLNADTSKDEDDPLNEYRITIETCL